MTKKFNKNLLAFWICAMLSHVAYSEGICDTKNPLKTLEYVPSPLSRFSMRDKSFTKNDACSTQIKGELIKLLKPFTANTTQSAEELLISKDIPSTKEDRVKITAYVRAVKDGNSAVLRLLKAVDLLPVDKISALPVSSEKILLLIKVTESGIAEATAILNKKNQSLSETQIQAEEELIHQLEIFSFNLKKIYKDYLNEGKDNTNDDKKQDNIFKTQQIEIQKNNDLETDRVLKTQPIQSQKIKENSNTNQKNFPFSIPYNEGEENSIALDKQKLDDLTDAYQKIKVLEDKVTACEQKCKNNEAK
ncbi:hypothetical protein P618_200101 [Holospora obtusa F1]|uniref:Uncharacterized protein n=2 Tax=Holospora obtusa TaxID=49893 RepID=W6TV86_HOLOB|nr:hypothetical protein P618_200101 [Holospora obtusa F1]